jgi:hypothetical protein
LKYLQVKGVYVGAETAAKAVFIHERHIHLFSSTTSMRVFGNDNNTALMEEEQI